MTNKAVYTPPQSILVIGSGVLGLSTVLALTRHPSFASSRITVIDRSPVIPASDAASVDSSRLIRADYSDFAYAKLAAEAHAQWRVPGPDSPGGEGRYHESGIVLVAHQPAEVTGKKTGLQYVRSSYENVLNLAEQKETAMFKDKVRTVEEALNSDWTTPLHQALKQNGAFADWGYVNHASGWVNSGDAMRWLYEKVKRTGRIVFMHGTVKSLDHEGRKVIGANLEDGRQVSADLTIVAAGAWTGSLVDLRGRAVATGQVLGYMDVTPEEQAFLEKMPVVLNLSTGLFVIPPANGELKIARHAYGYLNPQELPNRPLPASYESLKNLSQTSSNFTVSIPRTSQPSPYHPIPEEGESALRRAVETLIPLSSLHSRPFSRTRLCWYSDTPAGDFLIDYHPGWDGLFVATGDCGHAFKFLPVIGDEIVKCLMGECPEEFKDKWKFEPTTMTGEEGETYEQVVTEDGTRGGTAGLVLSNLSKATTKSAAN